MTAFFITCAVLYLAALAFTWICDAIDESGYQVDAALDMANHEDEVARFRNELDGWTGGAA